MKKEIKAYLYPCTGWIDDNKEENSAIKVDTVLKQPANPILIARRVPTIQKLIDEEESLYNWSLKSKAIIDIETILPKKLAAKVPKGNHLYSPFKLLFNRDNFQRSIAPLSDSKIYDSYKISCNQSAKNNL